MHGMETARLGAGGRAAARLAVQRARSPCDEATDCDVDYGCTEATGEESLQP
jgi:hypothetical protein